MGAAPKLTPFEMEMAGVMAQWRLDPVQYVHDVFKVTPDEWQADTLRAVAKDPRVGLSACVGPGKSTVMSWIGWWWLDTRYDATGFAASVTRENLRDNLWKEMAKWRDRAPTVKAAFDQHAERIVHKKRPETWFLSARGWAKDANPTQQASALGGFHGKHVLVLLDECGVLPDSVMVTAERIFANAEIDEARLVAAWNPETTDGAAYRICTRGRASWNVINVTGDPDDPKRSPRISLEWAKQQILDWGRDNDFVRVNVLGLFPLRGTDTLLGPDDITKAQARDVPEVALRGEASIWGLDPARSLAGDRAVLRERCGVVAFRPHLFRGLDGTQLGDRCSHILNESKRTPDYLFVDVGGVGASAFDRLVVLGWKSIIIPVDFAGSPDQDRFHDKNAEMHWRCAKWVRERGCLPIDSGVLATELTSRKFSYTTRGKRTAFAVESKDDLKARGLPSPDEADALALTFFSEHTPARAQSLLEAERRRLPTASKHERTWAEKRSR